MLEERAVSYLRTEQLSPLYRSTWPNILHTAMFIKLPRTITFDGIFDRLIGQQSLDCVNSVWNRKFFPDNNWKNDIMGMEVTRVPKIAGQYK
jgi:hypothetical protein